jgi:pimeloyl-ACP methyl ester carboxylesterase
MRMLGRTIAGALGFAAIVVTGPAHATSVADAQVEAVFGIPPWNELTGPPGSNFVSMGYEMCDVPTGSNLYTASEECIEIQFGGPPGPWFRSDLGVDSSGSEPPSGEYYASLGSIVEAPRCCGFFTDTNGKKYIQCNIRSFPSPPLPLVSPFLLGAKGTALANLDLASLLPALPSLAAAAATGLAADGTSAAIVLFATNTTSDVTFTTNNGTSLLPYDPQFLQKPPTLGSSPLVIPAANFMNIGGLIYAVALVQAPLPGVTPQYASPIVVTAQQGSETVSASLNLVPPPVLFAHGLWGNKKSLLFYQTLLSLMPPWSSYPDQLVAVGYPGADSFDSPESLTDMGTDVTTILGAVKSEGIVDGRVDVVAHSMGGLLVRAYSGGTCTTGAYRSLENRCQGKFHTIVTLDTPEAGSGLATYLLAHQQDTLKETLISDTKSFLFWQATCGTDPTITVAECLANNDDQVTSGAVASLVPDSSELMKAPNPHIANAHWRAVTATNKSGIERTGLKLLIQAIYTSPSLAPSLGSKVGVPNDDIVSLASQLTGSPVYVTFPGLAHSTVFGVGDSVVNSSDVTTQIACWLQDPASPACDVLPNVAAAVSKLNPEDMRPAPGRLVVEPPKAGWIGQPLTLRIAAAGVKRFEVRQVGQEDHTDEWIDATGTNGSSTLTITPRVLGLVRLFIRAEFADGSYDGMQTTFNVSVDPKIVSDFMIHSNHFPKLIVEMAGGHGNAFGLYPSLTVRGLDEPVEVGKFASFRLVSPDADPAATVDGNGVVTVHHPGQSIIEASFAGKVDRVTVEVE